MDDISEEYVQKKEFNFIVNSLVLLGSKAFLL